MELLERFARGELDAFEALFRQFQGEVYSWIVRLVRDPAAAEDLTVETFWRIYRSRSRFDASRSFGPWARRIATNVALDHLKTGRRTVELPLQLAQNSPGDAAVRREAHNCIASAFRKLPARLQATAILAIVEERTYDEIAQALGASVGTVKSRVFRATRLLRRMLKQKGLEP